MHNHSEDYVIVFIAIIAYIILSSITVFYVVSRSTHEYSAVLRDAFFMRKYNKLIQFSAYTLGLEYGRENIFKRFFMYLRLNHDYLGMMRWRFRLVSFSDVQALQQLMHVAVYLMNYLFLHAIFCMVLYPDSGLCEKYFNQQDCETRKSPTLVASQCRWNDGQICELLSPLQNDRYVYIACGFACLFAVPLNLCLCLAIDSHLSRYQQECDVSNSEPRLVSEIQTMLADAKPVVKHAAVLDNALPGYGFYSKYLQQQLKLDKEGNLRSPRFDWEDGFFYYLFQNPNKILLDRLRRSEIAALNLIQISDMCENEELKSLFLLRSFYIHCLPQNLRFYAKLFFLDTQECYSELINGSNLYKYSSYFLPAYFVIALIVILFVGFKWYDQITTAIWILFVVINIVFDILFHVPMNIFVKYIVMPVFFMPQLKTIQQYINLKYPKVLEADRLDAKGSFQLVQHMNPSCRVSSHPNYIATNVSGYLQLFSDFDLPLVVDTKDDKKSACEFFIQQMNKLLFFWCQSIYYLIPEAIFVLFINLSVATICLLVVLLFYSLSLITVFLPFVVLLVLGILVSIREILLHGKGKRSSVIYPTTKFQKRASVSFSGNNFDMTPQQVQKRILSVSVRVNKSATLPELIIIRKALFQNQEKISLSSTFQAHEVIATDSYVQPIVTGEHDGSMH